MAPQMAQEQAQTFSTFRVILAMRVSKASPMLIKLKISIYLLMKLKLLIKLKKLKETSSIPKELQSGPQKRFINWNDQKETKDLSDQFEKKVNKIRPILFFYIHNYSA